MRIWVLCSVGFLVGCGQPLPDEEYEAESAGDDYAVLEQGLVDCTETPSTGYRSGSAFPLTLIKVDGQLVEKRTGNAYVVMQDAAARSGVGIRINSGFRTPQEQQYLYNCYINCNCNSCNLAAAPGYSNHQSGLALDLNTANGAVFNWLNANAASYGFRRTVPSEPWHWEYNGGGPGGGPCTAPPPPPPCDRTAGPFTFSCDGPQSGQACVQLNEPADPNTWGDNFLCSKADYGLRWSNAGPIEGMTCTNTAESSEANPAIWADNFFCAPPQAPWKFSWSSAGPIAGRTCVHWNETADPNSWSDNFLCAEPVSSFSNAGYTFSMAGPAGANCVNVNEPSDPDTWTDNFFCSPTDLGMRWSHAGPLEGMRCTNVAESAEPLASMWADNFLCVPETSFVRFHWSSAGPIAGLPCVRWFEHSEASTTWLDNWMCVERIDGIPLEVEPPLELTEYTPSPASEPSAPDADDPMHITVEGRGCSSAPWGLSVFAVLLWARRSRFSRPAAT
jgi:hypothetical protein